MLQLLSLEDVGSNGSLEPLVGFVGAVVDNEVVELPRLHTCNLVRWRDWELCRGRWEVNEGGERGREVREIEKERRRAPYSIDSAASSSRRLRLSSVSVLRARSRSSCR